MSDEDLKNLLKLDAFAQSKESINRIIKGIHWLLTRELILLMQTAGLYISDLSIGAKGNICITNQGEYFLAV